MPCDAYATTFSYMFVTPVLQNLPVTQSEIRAARRLERLHWPILGALKSGVPDGVLLILLLIICLYATNAINTQNLGQSKAVGRKLLLLPSCYTGRLCLVRTFV